MSLKDQLKDVLAQANTLATKAQDEKRDFTDEENTTILDLKKKADDLREQIRKADEAQAAFKALAGPKEEGKAASPVEPKPVTAAKSYGEAFVKSKAYEAFKADQPHGTPVNITARHLHVKADPAPLSTALPGAIVPQMLPGYTDLTYPQPNTFLSLISMGTTSSSYVQYRQLVAVTNNAAKVKEGDLKPLSTLSTDVAEAHAFTLADGVKVTNQELADDGIIRSLIDTVLTRNLDSYKENMVLNGAGGSDQPTGILNTPGTLSVAYDKDIVHTVSHAITKLQQLVPGISIQAIVLNPADNEALNLMQDKNDRYLSNAPFATGPFTLFGVPRITSSIVPQGKALVGDFHSVQLLRKTPLSILAFNQNEDDARHNLTYVRAEEEDMLMIREPKRIAVATIAGTTPASK
ncbi:phage major capsid protein [Bifidobacterium sp. B4001]|uniref:phage major capsid protein n=1 Tax=unclassified Bifidobacterium TaxID=2608897 RepID=UPI00226B93AD|nr:MULTISPECIES: phage major capsid protein [unclassified Bifidobacterium]MCX8673000.1 phage major capsid protein [Bifidobacterium sp. B4079]MCX8681433.1 phage major capsid protein [Bifidobacterium sp. B4001]